MGELGSWMEVLFVSLGRVWGVGVRDVVGEGGGGGGVVMVEMLGGVM